MKKYFLLIIALAVILPTIVMAQRATLFHPITGDRKEVIVGTPDVFKGGYKLEEKAIGATFVPSGISVNIRQDLVAGASRSGSTLNIDPIITLDGRRVVMADIGGIAFGKLDQGTSNEEIISWTGITDNTSYYTLTGVGWGYNFYNAATSTANYKKHKSGATMIITNDWHFMDANYPSFNGDQTSSNNWTFGGTTTFSKLPLGPTGNPWLNSQFATKSYVDTVSATTSYWIISGDDIYYNTGRVSVGTDSPGDYGSGIITQVSEDANASDFLNVLTHATGYPVNIMSRARGTISSPTIVANGDFLGGVSFNGYDGTDFLTTGAQILARVGTTPGANDMPTDLLFNTTADGAAAPTIRMTILHDGKVGIGSTTPSKTLSVDGDVYIDGNALITGTGTSSITSNLTLSKWPVASTSVVTKGYADSYDYYSSGLISVAATTHNDVASHTLSVIPNTIKLTCTLANVASAGPSVGVWKNGLYTLLYTGGASAGDGGTETNAIAKFSVSATSLVATVSVTSQNITFAWTETGSYTVGAPVCLWEASYNKY